MPEHQIRVGRRYPADQRRRVGMEFEVMLDAEVEQRGGLRAVGRER